MANTNDTDEDDLTQPTIKTLLELSKVRGSIGVVGVLFLTVTIILQLSPEQKQTLQELWLIAISPSCLMLMINGFNTYLHSRDRQVQVQADIASKLDKMIMHIEKLFVAYKNGDMERCRRFDALDKRLDVVHKSIEKRKEYHHGDTEKFHIGEKK